MKIFSSVLFGSSIILSLFFLILLSDRSITFESLESKTTEGGSVFNQIRFIPSWKEDIWIMRQSHKGYHQDFQSWDKLAIIMDKSKTPYEAKFYQLKPGELNMKEFKPIANKARCFACHASGPRAVRANLESTFKLKWEEHLQIFVWNLRIKSYGRVSSLGGQETQGGVSFRGRHPVFKRLLTLQSCRSCHWEKGLRSPLTWEHLRTANFMVEKGFMPPFPFKVTKKDRETLKRLIE